MNTSVLYLEEVQSLFDRYRRGEISSAELESKRNELLIRANNPCFDSAWQRSIRWGGYLLGKASLVFAAGVCSLTLLLVLGAANLAPLFASDDQDEQMEPIVFTNSSRNNPQGLEDLAESQNQLAEDPAELWEI